MTISSRRRLFVLFAAAVALLAIERPVFAQAEDEAAARALFTEGRRLSEAGQYPEACAKFEAARSLYTSAGILLNLGDCYEKTGRTASAWATFGAAGSVAARTRRGDEAAEARKRQAKLESQLTRVVLRVARRSAGLAINRDGVEVPQAAWDAPIPVDPGNHEFRAEASGYTPWVKSVAVSDPGKTVTVDVPELVVLPAPKAPAPQAPAAAVTPDTRDTSAPRGATQQILGLVIGGAGVVGMGISCVMGLVAKSEFNKAENETDNRYNDSVSAGHLADAASVVFVAGAVATGAGVVIWLTAPRAPVSVGANGRAVFVFGSF
jgi:tetratricopeptide (TPR) repeat protein